MNSVLPFFFYGAQFALYFKINRKQNPFDRLLLSGFGKYLISDFYFIFLFQVPIQFQIQLSKAQ